MLCDMTPKERLLTAMWGEQTDRIPWSPFLAYWWENQSESLQTQGQLAFYESIGADPLLRGTHTLHKKVTPNCEVRSEDRCNERQTTLTTPVGTLFSRHRFSPAGNTWFLTEHPVKSIEDMKILMHLYEHMRLEPSLSEFEAEHRNIGSRGLYLPLVGADSKSCFQSLVEYWAGTEELVYMIADDPDVVSDCLAVMREVSIQTATIAAESSAEAFIFWEDSSTTNASPSHFETYAAPEIAAWANILHGAGKLLVHHACGHLKDLLAPMTATGIDMIESISPPPTGNIELWDAEARLPDHVGLIGGIEPTVLLHSSVPQLLDYINVLLSKLKGRRYILANSDSCPPGVAVEKLLAVTALVKNRTASQ